MRRFNLRRETDATGVSGTGIVAQGVEADSGAAVLFWLKAPRSVVLYDSVLDLISVHGHDGATTIEWIDEPLSIRVARARAEREERDGAQEHD